jgi:hypothetical protein
LLRRTFVLLDWLIQLLMKNNVQFNGGTPGSKVLFFILCIFITGC